MEFKGTKGDWYYDKVKSKGIKCNSVKGLLATAWNTYNADEVEVRLDGESWLSMRDRTKHIRASCEDEKISNAKLIAAAPELLNALQELGKLIDDGDLVRDISNDDDSHYFTMQGLRITKAIGKYQKAINKALK